MSHIQRHHSDTHGHVQQNSNTLNPTYNHSRAHSGGPLPDPRYPGGEDYPAERYSNHAAYQLPWAVYPYGIHQSPSTSPISAIASPTTAGVLRQHRYNSSRPIPPPQTYIYHMPSPTTTAPRESAVNNGNRNGILINNGLHIPGSPVDNSPGNSLKDHCDTMLQHPLFPLLRFLLEKLEEATLSAVTPAPDTINAELEGMARRIQQNHSSINCGNPDIDDLMIQGVTVLRLHLFELEKVNELCRDFCNRYTDCLRRNLQTDRILRNDPVDSDHSSESMTPTGGQHVNSMPLPVNLAQNSPVYQMVSTPQGLVARSIPVTHLPEPCSMALSDPLSVRDVMSPSSVHSQYGEDKYEHDPDDSSSPKGDRVSRRGILPKDAINVMKTWLFQHIVHPYPTEDEKRLLATQTRLSLLQVNNWFINARRRILQPMLDATNSGGQRAKKGMQSRPVDPFWSESAVQSVPVASSSSSDDPHSRPQNAHDDGRYEEEETDEGSSEEDAHHSHVDPRAQFS